jgi:hypothetical protein
MGMLEKIPPSPLAGGDDLVLAYDRHQPLHDPTPISKMFLNPTFRSVNTYWWASEYVGNICVDLPEP